MTANRPLAATLAMLVFFPLFFPWSGRLSAGQKTADSGVEVSAKVRYTYSGPSAASSAKLRGANHRTVIWLVPSDPLRIPASHPATYSMVQKGKQFHPGLMVVPVGSKVSFPNADPFFHNVFSLFNGRRFDLGLYQSGQTREIDFNRPGVSYIFCNIHPEMTAVIISLRTPYSASLTASGTAVLHGVPPGNYTLEVWSELASPEALAHLTRAVTVGNTDTDLGDIGIPVSALGLGDHLNKFGQPYDTHIPDRAY